MNLDFYVKYCSLASSDYCGGGATTDSGRSSATVSPTLSSSDVSLSSSTPNFAPGLGSVHHHQSPIAAMLINAASINNKQQQLPPPSPVSPTTSCDSGNGGGSASGTANPKYKTEMCRSVFAKIQCKYGDNCQFAHSEEEMRNRPRNNKYKTINCKNFHLKGYCYYGPKCDFRHNEPLPPNFSGTSNADRFRFSSVSPPCSSSFATTAATKNVAKNFVDSSSIFSTNNLLQQQRFNHQRSSPSFDFLSLTTVDNGGSSGGLFSSTFLDSTTQQQQQQQRQSAYFCRRTTGSDGDSPAPSDYDSLVQV